MLKTNQDKVTINNSHGKFKNNILTFQNKSTRPAIIPIACKKIEAAKTKSFALFLSPLKKLKDP